MKKFKQILSSVLAATLVLSLLPLSAAAAKVFSDTKGHWAEKVINSAVTRGYINGYENNTFKPNNAVTRAEFCKMLNNALTLRGTTTHGFKDVSTADWFQGEVAKAVAAGYIAGYEDNSFRANAQISRQEAAVVISRLVSDAGTQKDLSALRDSAQIDSWARSGASSVYSKGYMAGDNNKRFNPKGNLTRAEAVQIIESILGAENISHSNATLNTANQTVSNTVYTGDLTVYTSGAVTFQNCRVLGSLQVQGEGTVRLQNSRVSRLDVNVPTGKTEVIAAGTAEVSVANLSSGASLSESSVSGGGFQKVNLTGSRVATQDVYLTGSFSQVQLQSQAKMSLRSGSIKQLSVSSGASGSKIDMASGSVVERAELNGTADFTGRGVITLAVINMAGSTFETQPISIQGKNTLVPSITPKNGSSDASLRSDIVLTFSEIPFTSSNTVVTTSYVENSVVELRRASQSGTKVGFDVTLSNNNRVFTINPDDDFDAGVKYFVIIKSALRNSRSEANEYTVYSFTAGGGLVPAPYPADGATTIPVSLGQTNGIQLSFGESIYQSNGSTTLSNNYLQNTALELRRSSATGTTVPFTASVSNGNKTVTIKPNTLDTSTRYYVIVKDGTLANTSRSPVGAHSFSFTTASTDILVPAMTPSPNASKVAVNDNIVLEFDTAIYTANGSSVDADYLDNNVFTLRRGSRTGATTSFAAHITTNKKTVTLTPSSNLQANTTYYLIMENRSISNSTSSSRKQNEKQEFTFTTGTTSSRENLEPVPNPKNGASGVSTNASITLSFDTPIYKTNAGLSVLDNSYLINNVLELRQGSVNGSRFTNFTATISRDNRTVTINLGSNLTTNTRYYILVAANSIKDADGNRNKEFTSNFTCGTAVGNLVPTMNPAHGAIGVAPDASIALDFAEALYDNSNNQLSNNSSSRVYLEKNAIELRVGSEGGQTVPFTVNSISSSRYITIKPNNNLTTGQIYFVVLPAGYLRNDAGKTNPRTVLRFTVGSGLTSTHTPAVNESNVARDRSIVLRFNQRLYSVEGSAPALDKDNINAYMKKYARLTGNGVSVQPNFTASINTDGTEITIKPDEALQANKTYSFSLPADRLASYKQQKNSQISFSFTTSNSALVPTIAPTGKVPLNGSVSINFPEKLFRPGTNNIPLEGADVPVNVIELSTSSSSGGSSIAYDATVSNDGKSIAIRPKKDLLPNTRYYVHIKEKSLANSAKELNAAYTLYFETVGASHIEVKTFEIPPVNLDGTQDMHITFSEDVFDEKKNALSSQQIIDRLKVKGATELTPTKATASKKVITLTFEKGDVTPKTDYTVTAEAGLFADNAGNKNEYITKTKKSDDIAIKIEARDVGKDSATIVLSYNYPGAFTMDVTGGNATLNRNEVTPTNAKGTHEWKITQMEEGKEYTVKVSYGMADGTTGSKSIQLSTQSTSKDATLKYLGVEYGGAKYAPVGGLTANGRHPMTVDKGSVKIIATANDSKATVSIDKNETVTVGDSPVEVIVTVTAEGENQATYTLVLTGV